MSTSLSVRRVWLLAALTAAALLLAVAARPAPASAATKPTIVFVHGAFADSSGWLPPRGLGRKGYRTGSPSPTRCAACPPTPPACGLFLSTIRGPIMLVGHSYGGAVITNAATGNPNVKALVYIAAFAPEARRVPRGPSSTRCPAGWGGPGHAGRPALPAAR